MAGPVKVILVAAMPRKHALAHFMAALTASMLFVAVGPAAGGSAANPDVTDDPSGEPSLPPELNLIAGWVGNETEAGFSTFMKVESLAAPGLAAHSIHYHFHFQVEKTDGNTSLYHAMVHHHADGMWMWMVQRWIPSAGAGAWGNTHDTRGTADGVSGVLEVHVEKAWIDSPRVDLAKNTWTIHSFYLHADLVEDATGDTVRSDTAPAAGTMGSYTVSVGAPAVPGGSAASAAFLAGLAVVSAVAAFAILRPSARARGRR